MKLSRWLGASVLVLAAGVAVAAANRTAIFSMTRGRLVSARTAVLARVLRTAGDGRFRPFDCHPNSGKCRLDS